MKNEEFHIPFLKQLVIIGLVTLVSMMSVRFFFNYYLSDTIYTPSFASEKFYSSSDQGLE